jgi:hypothetical protein
MNLGIPGHVIDILEAGSLDAGAGDVVLPLHDNVRALCEIRCIDPMTLAGANDPPSADISSGPTSGKLRP